MGLGFDNCETTKQDGVCVIHRFRLFKSLKLLLNPKISVYCSTSGSTSSIFFNWFIDISLIVLKLGIASFWKIVEDPHCYYLGKSKQDGVCDMHDQSHLWSSRVMLTDIAAL